MQAAPLVLGIAGAVLHSRRKPPSSAEQQGEVSPLYSPPQTPPLDASPRSAGKPRSTPPPRAIRRFRYPLLLCLLCCLLSLAVTAGVVLEQSRDRVLSVAVACAVCNALALVLLVRLQRSLRVVKRPSKLPAKRLEDDLCNFEAKLLRPLPQEGLDELARQLSGYWHKDNDASDSMDGPLNVIQAPWLLRQAVHFIVGLELKLIGGDFHFIVCSRIQWFKIREVFAIGGEGRRFQRRDLRGGGATGRCAITAEGVWLAVEWGDPFAGREWSHFFLTDGGSTLTARSRIILRDEQRVDYTTVYRKRE